jgi:16S rRNA (cytosine967-C5)-methyltransferase
VLAHGSRVPDLPGFTEGWFSVQDPSTAVAPALLDPGPGQRVLDACAAPGGKTFVLAERMRGRGTLWAADVSPGRLRRLEENLKRMGLEWVQVRRADAASPLLGRMCGGEGFDRILLDVPCSTTGVLRRRPDARWRFSPERLNQLTRIQQAMLNNAATLLRPGGRLVYSTCSLEPEEGTELVRAWLRGRPEFRLLEERSLFPPDTQTDGVYAAALCCGG